jgi:hypothetical protein
LTVGYRRGGDQLLRGILTGEEHDTERWLREVAIAGSPEIVAERFVAPRNEFGFGGFQLVTGFLGIVPQKHVVTTLELFPREVRPRVGERSSWFCVTNGMGTVEIPVSAASASFAHGILAVNGSGRVPDAPLQASCPEFARRYNLARVSRLFAAG